MWFLYNILFAVAFALLLPRYLFRMWRRGGYLSGFPHRLGVFSREEIARIQERPRTWIHAVSVGEMLVAMRFAGELREQDGSAAFVVTTTTSTAHAVAAERLDDADVLLYFPVDFPVVVRRVLEVIQPRALVLVETELWPNLVRYARKRGVPVALVNGRISAQSARGYRLLRPFFRRTLDCIDVFCVQSRYDEGRLVDIGARPERVKVVGSAKYDVTEVDGRSETNAEKVLLQAGMSRDDLLLVGGSTWPGEETILLDLFKKLKPDFDRLRLVLVPRHFERGDRVAEEISRHDLACTRRSELGDGTDGAPGADVLLVDTTGELTGFYACATVIFVGKSLTRHGGQNIVEPALCGKPIVVGPNMENFPDVADDFRDADAFMQVADVDELEQVFRRLLEDHELRAAYGRRAGELVASRRGVIRATVKILGAVLPK